MEAERLTAWEALEPSPFKARLLAAVERKGSSAKERIVMRQDAGRKCVMLDEAGLCSVHRQSEGLLATICRDFPRMVCHYGERTLTTANLSCPEVVRLVLTADLADQFEATADAVQIAPMGVNLSGQAGQLLEEFVKQALAERRFPLAVRIGGIAEVLVQLMLASQQGVVGLPVVQRLCAKPKQRLYELNQKFKSRHFRAPPAVAGRFWKFIASSLGTDDARPLFDPAYTQSEFVQRAMAAETDAECEALYAEIMDYRDKAVFELGETGRLYGDKYLLVKFFNSGFPIAPRAGNFIATFLFCVYPYALIQLCLWLAAEQNGKVSNADVLSMISRVERMLGHSDKIYHYLEQNAAALRLDLYYQCLLDL